MQQQHSGSGDNVGGNKIDRLVETGIYTENHYYYGEKKIFRALTKPPFMPEVFLGREDDLLTIKDKLFSGDNLLLLVNGQGGVGKTSIAAKYYEAYNTHYAHTAWVLSEKSITNALLFNLVTPLGIELGQNWTEAQRFDEILRGMAELKKPCLLVIDNANELNDLEQNYPQLNSCRNFHVLLTTRITKFEQAALHPIEGLKEADAVKMFKRHYSEHNENEDDLLKEIIAAVDNNTLIVELLAKNLQNLNELEPTYHLHDLLNDIQNSLVQLSKSEVVSTIYQTKAKGLRFEKPEDIILAMYDLSELNDAEKHLLSNFAVLPAERITFDILKLLLPQKDDLKTTLLSLAKKGWLDYSQKDKSFKISPVIQHITKRKNAATLLNDCGTLIQTLKDELQRDKIHKDNYKMSTVFARYAETVVVVFDESNFNAVILFQRIGTYYETIGNLDRATIFYEKFSNLSKKLCKINPNNADFKNGLAISYEKLGLMHTALGNLANALRYYEDYNRLENELYAAYPTNVSFKDALAISYQYLGYTHTSLGNLEKALNFYKDYNHLEKELYATYPTNVSFKNNLASSYEKLGNTCMALGNLERALILYEEYNCLEKELCTDNPTNVSFKNGLAISHCKVGNTHMALGNLEKALSFYKDYNDLEKELYAAYSTNVSFKNNLAISYSKLGDTYTAMGNLEKALTFNENANQTIKELYTANPTNVSFKNGLAVSYSKLGETHTSLDNLDKALGFYEDYNRLEKELYTAYPNNVEFKNGLAISYYKLGVFSRDNLKDKSKALANFKLAESFWIELVRDAPQFVEFQKFLKQIQKELVDL